MSDGLNRTQGRSRIATPDAPLQLDCGVTLTDVEIAYETYGVLNDARDNVVVVCHALTGSAHVAGVGNDGSIGWWDGLVGPGRAIDTRRWFVIGSNVLGGCYGSTGASQREDFPTITIRDMVRAQRALVARLGVERVHAIIGGSMGGMQVLEWAALYPELVDRIIPICTAGQQSPWCIGFNAIAREALDLGRAAGDDAAGLRLARKVGMISYRSGEEFQERFGRARAHDEVEPVDGTFDVERYLERHGRKLVARFDAATYRTLTRAMDLHDLAWGRGPIDEVLGAITQPALCVGISTDVRYPVTEQKELARLLPNGIYREIDSICGHDAFLIEHDQLGAFVRPFLEKPSTARCIPTTNTSPSEIEA
jgi:homoserine O-acetyltransferase/O-succinyltransferase